VSQLRLGGGHRFLGAPGSALRSQLGVPVSRSPVGRRVAVCLDTGAGAVACAAGAPAYGVSVVASPELGTWSGLGCRVHGRVLAIAPGRFVFFRRCLKVAPPMSRDGYISLTCVTPRRGYAIAGCRCGRLLGEKHETPVRLDGLRGLRRSKCLPPLTGHPHRCQR
jgi:hypothetical protein